MQLAFDYSARYENNRFSQDILDSNATRINTQCDRLLEMFKSGARLTVIEACNLKEPISDLRRRVKDLRDAGVPIKDEIVNGRFKVYFMEKRDR